jgi:hypothetical protein
VIAEIVLKGAYPHDIVDALLDSYREIESNFVLRKWKASELDAGHFVEAARRCIEHKLFGTATPLSQQLSKFSDSVLAKYESAVGDESHRILIPRVLRSIFGIRNKRGVGHLGALSANEMDATLILYSVKWVLAEFVRLSSGLAPAETQRAIDQIVERRVSALWKHDGPTRVIPSLKASDQVLVLLYDSSPQAAQGLQASIEYSNASKFRSILKKLHRERLIELSASMDCSITPKGMLAAESLLLRLSAMD